MAYAYANMLNSANKEHGLSDHFFFAPVSEMASIKCPATADDVVIATAHTFTDAVDGGFYKVICAPAKQKITSTLTGEQGSLKMMNTFEAFVPGSDEPIHKLIKHLKNEPLIILAPDANCDSGINYQLGCDCIYAFLSADGGFESGTTKDGQKGYKLKFEYPGSSVLMYTAVVTEHA